MKYYEIRDPIFGFITINEWEREIIDHWAFQRLRRIKQLAWTPGLIWYIREQPTAGSNTHLG